MNVRTKTIVAACATLALAGAASVQPAQARWIFHDDSLGEKISAPAGATRASACADRLRAVSGWGRFIDVDAGEDPAAFTIPAQARTSVTYDVWKAPPGFHSFLGAIDEGTGQIYFEDADGTRHQARLVGEATTAARAPLPRPEPSGGNPNVSDNFVFTSARISVPLTHVAPGDALGLKPANAFGFVNVRAMDCHRPVVKARVDVLPGTRRNAVHPTSTTERIPVRIFGSRHLDVRRITGAHLGEAAPAAVGRPKDVDRDGRADRLYVFRQTDTDIMCIDATVKVTGRIGPRYLEGANPITTAGCGG